MIAIAATPEPAQFSYELREELLATTEEVQEALKAGTKLVDGRPVEQYEGKSKSPVVRTVGTLPGAVNIVHSTLYSGELALASTPESVKSLMDKVGVGADEKNIAFCNTGHWASVAWFGLSEIAGNKNTSMYDGSMAEWTADGEQRARHAAAARADHQADRRPRHRQ